MFAPGRDRVDLDSLLGRNADDFMQVARGRVLQVGGGMWRDALVQHRLVIEAGDDRNLPLARRGETIQLDGENRTEWAQHGEYPIRLLARVHRCRDLRTNPIFRGRMRSGREAS